MKSISITDSCHESLEILKNLLKEKTNESYGQIVTRLVQEEIKRIEMSEAKAIFRDGHVAQTDNDGNIKFI